jgi:hypothetical protein
MSRRLRRYLYTPAHKRGVFSVNSSIGACVGGGHLIGIRYIHKHWSSYRIDELMSS